MPNHAISCEECHRRKQRCNKQIPCQHCIARGKEDVCRPHEVQLRPKDLLEERLTAVEEELSQYRRKVDHFIQQQGINLSNNWSQEKCTSINRIDQDTGDNDADSHTNEGQVSTPEIPPIPQAVGEEMERRQVGSVLDEMKKTRLVDLRHSPQLRDPPLYNKEQLSEVALQNHGIPKTCFSDLVSVLPPRHTCEALVTYFYTNINWIRQPWPRRSLCQSFDTFWSKGPSVTFQNINTFALLCGLCAIARLTIEDANFDSDANTRKLQARQLHFTSRHALMLSSVFNREDLDQIIAWTLASRFLVLQRRYVEAYTCAARTVKAAYMIDLHRDGSKLGLSTDITEARRKVWSAVYYFDRTISMLTGRPPVVDDRFCDVLPPSESGYSDDIYPLAPSLPRHLFQEGVQLPTVYAYCAHRHAIAMLQGRMVAIFLHVQDGSGSRNSRDKELSSIYKDLQSFKSSLPTYLQVESDDQGGVVCDRSLDESYGYLPIQRFLLQSEMIALCIGLHRPFLLSTKKEDANSLHKCMDAALLDIALHKDFMRNYGTSTQLELQVYIGSHRWFHSVLLCGLVLLAHPQLGRSNNLLELLTDFVDLAKRPLDSSTLDPSSIRETEVINIFIQGYQNRQKADGEKGGSSKRKRKSRTAIAEVKQARMRKSEAATTSDSILQQHEGQSSMNSFPRTDSSDTIDQSAGSKSSTPAQHLFSSLYARGSTPLLSASNSAESIDISGFSQVFGGSECMQPQQSTIVNTEQTMADVQADDWFGRVPIHGLDENSPWSQHPAPSPLVERPTIADNDTIDVEFWLDLIKKL